MKCCIINKQTGVCVNIVELDSTEQFNSTDTDLIVAPEQSGQIGWRWSDSSWVQTPDVVYTTEELCLFIRIKRNKLLKRFVDRMNPIRWEELSEEKKQEWKTYRQALLDIPEQDGFPINVIWPAKPQN